MTYAIYCICERKDDCSYKNVISYGRTDLIEWVEAKGDRNLIACKFISLVIVWLWILTRETINVLTIAFVHYFS